MLKENLWIQNTAEAFNNGCFENTLLADDSKTHIILTKTSDGYVHTGSYTSSIIETLPFNALILSWNGNTPEGTSIEIEAQVRVEREQDKKWSSWLSWGTWSTSCGSSSAEHSEDELAKVNTDVLRVKGIDNESASAVRYRITLKTSKPETTPSLNLVAGTMRNSGTIIDNPVFNSPEVLTAGKILDVPRFSQMLRDPKIASVICSPTSITMILNYHGLNLIPEDTAAKVFDKVYDGYGNWPFNTAFAGSAGFEAYVAYCSSVLDLTTEIEKGCPLAVSVRYKNSEEIEANLPIIHGSPIKKTNGHLIVVCGFIKENDKEYIVVNDPAAESNETVRLMYDIEEFDAAWKTSGRVAYIIHPQ
jgi:uncharacterized protein YvpB